MSVDLLTSQQNRVLERVALGESNKTIAAALDLTESTVKHHSKAAMKRLGVTNRTAAARIWWRECGGGLDHHAARIVAAIDRALAELAARRAEIVKIIDEDKRT